MKRVPIESCHIPAGSLMEAEVAIPPSPKEEDGPFPATVATRYDWGAADVIMHPQTAKVKRKTTVERVETNPNGKTVRV
jgi:hypothetical protein